MRNRVLLTANIVLLVLLNVGCQSPTTLSSTKKSKSVPNYVSKKGSYNASNPIEFDLIHTKLEVGFDLLKKQLKGKATLKLKPFFYPQDTLVLDAKGFEIHKITIIEPDFSTRDNYLYDMKKIRIPLPHTFLTSDTLIVEVVYTAKPEELPKSGSKSIMETKGLYFINTDQSDSLKPVQIWTQGETESASCWFPTIDSPNQKCSQEIFITVPSDYTTISNGTLVYTLQNADGTKTDYWKQDLPHAPYLFMMAIGKFAKVCDRWKDKDICYYVEPKYNNYAKNIFGNTPEMLEYFSSKLNYTYPWDKYAQIVVRDFVSGAMENTSASIFMEALQMDRRELLDRNWDGIIAHELFHHWFGDLVTCESWAHLALNESFANYSEYLWFEYKYGKDEADHHIYEELNDYLEESEEKQEPIIRYHYLDKEDMFDAHSYNKGGCILNLLRNTIGDDAFFASLNLYLKQNQFKSAEIHHLRLAVEEITGRDMNWFFEQYFLKPGHVKLVVEHSYANKQLRLKILQAQDSLYTPIYQMPLKIAIWSGGKRIEKNVLLNKDLHEFSWSLDNEPENVVVDADQTLVGVLFHTKKTKEWIHQYQNETKWRARKLAVMELKELLFNTKTADSTKNTIKEFLPTLANDPHWNIRKDFLDILSKLDSSYMSKHLEKCLTIALFEKKTLVRAQAIQIVSKLKPNSLDYLTKGLMDSSYAVLGASLKAYYEVDKANALGLLNQYNDQNNSSVLNALSYIYTAEKDSSKLDWFTSRIPYLAGGKLYRFLIDFNDYLKVLPASSQKKALPTLYSLAENNPFVYARMMAYNGLHNLRNLEGVKDKMKEIRTKETNSLLIEHYKKLK